MDKLIVHIVGTGAVGLAYGYLLSAQGHTVIHTSLRGVVLPTVPVRVTALDGSSEVRANVTYVPRYKRTVHNDIEAHVRIFAVGPQDLPHALSQWGGATDAPAPNLIFCSNPSPLESAWRKASAVNCVLVYPLLSAEIDANNGLTIATNRAVELCLPPEGAIGARLMLGALFERMALTISAYVTPQCFHARFLRTSAVYVVLLAISNKMVERSTVSSRSIASVFDALQTMTRYHEFVGGFETSPVQRRDFPQSGDAQFEAIAALIARRVLPPAESVLGDNIEYLLHDGRRKLHQHLRDLTGPWNRYMATIPAIIRTSTQELISLIFSLSLQV